MELFMLMAGVFIGFWLCQKKAKDGVLLSKELKNKIKDGVDKL